MMLCQRRKKNMPDEQDELFQKHLNTMKLRILQLEKENLKTQAKTTAQMVEEIRQIIKEEAVKIY